MFNKPQLKSTCVRGQIGYVVRLASWRHLPQSVRRQNSGWGERSP